MVDEYVYGRVERISPEAPVPVVVKKSRELFPGGAGNVARNLQALGAQVCLAGVVGDDEGARYLKKYFYDSGMKQEQIALSHIKGRPTTRKTRIIAERQQLCRLDEEIPEALSWEELREVRSYIHGCHQEIGAIIFSDYDKGLIIPELIAESVELCRQSACLIAVDPQVRHFDYYKKVDLLTPNHHEAGLYLGRRLEGLRAIEMAGPEILARLEAHRLLITRGAEGMSLFEREIVAAAPVYHKAQHFPTRAREVFDVTGAGDTVIAIATLALAAQASIEEAIALANAGAGRVVAHIGAACVQAQDLLQEFSYS